MCHRYDRRMTRVRPHTDPLTGVDRVVIDGTNVLHALSRGPDRQPPAALIGRLRAAIPPELRIELVFDGPPDRGLAGARIAHGLTVRYGGRFSADSVIVTLVEEVGIAAGGRPGQASAAADALLVVTDDRELRHAVGRRGARTAGSAWLLRRLERPRLASPAVANRRPPAIAQPPAGAAKDKDADAERTPWKPGRDATRKRGPAKRPPKPR
jgi:hypothetical protein